MKVITKLAVGLAVAFVTSALSAGTLYWQVTSDTGVDFTVARLVVTDGSTTAYLPSSDGVFAADYSTDTGTGTYVNMQHSDISSYETDAWSFYVEMINYATPTETITKGQTYSYEDLYQSGYISFGPDDITAVTIAAGAANMGANSVPEPTSGLLLLMGGAMLALRRRRQK